MTEKRFLAMVKVTRDLQTTTPHFGGAYAKEHLIVALHDLVGPRGGRYVSAGPIEFMGETGWGDWVSPAAPHVLDDDFMTGQVSFIARRMGKYVRPKR